MEKEVSPLEKEVSPVEKEFSPLKKEICKGNNERAKEVGSQPDYSSRRFKVPDCSLWWQCRCS